MSCVNREVQLKFLGYDPKTVKLYIFQKKKKKKKLSKLFLYDNAVLHKLRVTWVSISGKGVNILTKITGNRTYVLPSISFCFNITN